MKLRLLSSALIVFLLTTFLAGCSVRKNTGTAPVSDGLVTFKIIQLNDIYEIEPLNDGEYGGMARVAHVADSIRKVNPNTLLFLAGDFLNPSLLGTIKLNGERIRGKQMVEVMNALKFDLVTFGNHEFDLKENELQKRLNESEFEWTSANTRHVVNGTLQPFYSEKNGKRTNVSDYATFQISEPDGDQAILGIFSVTIDSNPQDFVHYANIYDEAERAYKNLQKEADITLGLTHVSLEQDRNIAKRLPEVPLLMGGHEHYNMLIKEGSTIITKADANAKTIFVHTFIYNIHSKDLNIDSQLVAIDRSVNSHPEVEKIVNRWSRVLEDNLKEIVDNPNEIIYNAEIPWDGTDESSRAKQTNLGEIITKSMLFVFPEAEAAFVNGGSIRIDDRLSGAISSKDIFRILLFGGSVVKVDLKGSLLKQVLDYGMESRGTGAYLQRTNFSRDGGGQWNINHIPIDPEKIYTIAMSDFLLRGLDIPFLTSEHEDVIKVYHPLENENAADIRKTIIAYLKSLH